MSVADVADDLLWLSAVVWVWLGAVYIFAERGSGWLRWGLMLTVVGVAQMILRALATLMFGEDYPGRDWLLLTGRLEILTAGIILAVALHRARWGTRQSRCTARRAADATAPYAGTPADS
jgi:hypothetical protein